MWSSSQDNFGNIAGELQKVHSSLQVTVRRFGRALAKQSVRYAPRVRGGNGSVPAPRGGRPRPHPPSSPVRSQGGHPKSALEQQRAREYRLRGGKPPFATAVEQGAGRVADAIRERLLALRGRLGALRSQRGGSR